MGDTLIEHFVKAAADGKVSFEVRETTWESGDHPVTGEKVMGTTVGIIGRTKDGLAFEMPGGSFDPLPGLRAEAEGDEDFVDDQRMRGRLLEVVDHVVQHLNAKQKVGLNGDKWRPVNDPEPKMARLRRMKTLAYLKLGEHRGKKRFWQEGRQLERAGFTVGSRFTVDFDEGKRELRVRVAEDGERKVSGRKRVGKDERLPVIDINNRDLAKVLGEGIGRVRVIITDETLVIAPHPFDIKAEVRQNRLIDRMSRGEPLAIGSVAHGGGVLDHAAHQGLEDTGVDAEGAFFVEIDHRYLEASLQNNVEIWSDRTLAVEAPMQEVETGQLPPVDIYIGGVPCTGASLAGRAKLKTKHAESHDSAGSLFYAYLKILEAVNPAVAVLENVPQYANTASMEVIRSVLDQLGYDIHEKVFDGGQWALEDRKRFVMLAVTKGLEIDLDAIEPSRIREARLGDILEDVPADSDRWREMAYLNEKAERDAERVRTGQMKGTGFKLQKVDGDSTKVGVIGRQYWKCRSTEPAVTRKEDKMRRLLTPHEHAAVKTIPSELIAGLSDTVAHEILGQSVIHGQFRDVFAMIGNAIKAFAEVPTVDVEDEEDEEYRPGVMVP